MSKKAPQEQNAQSLAKIAERMEELSDERDAAAGSSAATQAYLEILLSMLPQRCLALARHVAGLARDAHNEMFDEKGRMDSAEHYGGIHALDRIIETCNKYAHQKDSKKGLLRALRVPAGPLDDSPWRGP